MVSDLKVEAPFFSQVGEESKTGFMDPCYSLLHSRSLAGGSSSSDAELPPHPWWLFHLREDIVRADPSGNEETPQKYKWQVKEADGRVGWLGVGWAWSSEIKGEMEEWETGEIDLEGRAQKQKSEEKVQCHKLFSNSVRLCDVRTYEFQGKEMFLALSVALTYLMLFYLLLQPLPCIWEPSTPHKTTSLSPIYLPPSKNHLTKCSTHGAGRAATKKILRICFSFSN